MNTSTLLKYMKTYALKVHQRKALMVYPSQDKQSARTEGNGGERSLQ